MVTTLSTLVMANFERRRAKRLADDAAKRGGRAMDIAVDAVLHEIAMNDINGEGLAEHDGNGKG